MPSRSSKATTVALITATIIATTPGPALANRSAGQASGTVIIITPPPQPFPVHPHPPITHRGSGQGSPPFGSSMPPSLPFGQSPRTFNSSPITPPAYQPPYGKAYPSRRTPPEFLPQPRRPALPPDSIFHPNNR